MNIILVFSVTIYLFIIIILNLYNKNLKAAHREIQTRDFLVRYINFKPLSLSQYTQTRHNLFTYIYGVIDNIYGQMVT